MSKKICLIGHRSIPIPIGLAVAVFTLWLGKLHGANGVVYYNATTNSSSPAALRWIHGDGTRDQAVPVGLREAAVPSVSRDGRRVLLTSPDPNRPFKITQNVYSLDLADGRISQVTAFEDFVNRGNMVVILPNGALENPNDPLVSAYTTHLPNYKAYSPDGSRVAVFNFSATSGTLMNMNGRLQAFGASSPSLAVHMVGSPHPLGTVIQPGAERTFSSHGGDGVDWHPNRDEVVAAFRVNIPVTGTAGITQGEGTVVAMFATDGRMRPFLRNLTAPTGVNDVILTENFGFIILSQFENDYAPTISADGQRVAYVRNTIRFDSRVGLAPLPCHCSIRVIQYDGTGDREILALPVGAFVTRLSWSPDGSEIAYDTAPQLQGPGANYYLIGDATRSEIRVVRSDGSNSRILVQAPASSPSWASTEIALPASKPSVRITRAGNELSFRIENLPVGRPVEIESTPNFQQWTVAQQFQSSGQEQVVRLPLAPNPGRTFYRVVIR